VLLMGRAARVVWVFSLFSSTQVYLVDAPNADARQRDRHVFGAADIW
jgi:hypothetical protein